MSFVRTSQCKSKVMNKHRMSTYRIETNAGQGMAFRRNFMMFRPPALVSIETRDIEWPGTSSPAPFPRSSLSQVPACWALSSICRMPSCQKNAPRVYVCRPDKHQMQESHAHVLVGYKMKHPWREKGVSPESQWALRPTTNASSRSKQAHSTGAHRLRPVHRSPAGMTGEQPLDLRPGSTAWAYLRRRDKEQCGSAQSSMSVGRERVNHSSLR